MFKCFQLSLPTPPSPLLSDRDCLSLQRKLRRFTFHHRVFLKDKLCLPCEVCLTTGWVAIKANLDEHTGPVVYLDHFIVRWGHVVAYWQRTVQCAVQNGSECCVFHRPVTCCDQNICVSDFTVNKTMPLAHPKSNQNECLNQISTIHFQVLWVLGRLLLDKSLGCRSSCQCMGPSGIPDVACVCCRNRTL